MVEITQLQYIKVYTDENDVNWKDRIIDIEVDKINIKEVDIDSKEYPKSNGEEENIIDKENTSMSVINEEDVIETITVKWKGDYDTVVDNLIEENDKIRNGLALKGIIWY